MRDSGWVAKAQAARTFDYFRARSLVWVGVDMPRLKGSTIMPPVDVVEDANGITLYADLPGVPRENLHLHLEADSLTIEATVKMDMPQQMESSHASQDWILGL